MIRNAVRKLVAVTLASAGFSIGTLDAAAQQPNALDGLVVDVRADKRAYVLGEPVALDIRIANRSPIPVLIPAVTDVWVGNVEVFVADTTGAYRKYLGPGWGLRDVAGDGTQTLQSGRPLETSATLLYNHGWRADHLNAAARAERKASRLSEGFAISTPGIYSVVVIFRGGDLVGDVVSEPVDITISEPDGVDRQVWDALRVDPDNAYFLHTGSTRAHPASDRSVAMVAALDALADTYPSSRYAETIRRRVATHGARVEELRERGLIAR